MVPDALVAASLLVAGVLMCSGVAKLRQPEPAVESYAALGVPQPLRHPAVVAAHPWVEVALGVALLTLPGPGAPLAAAFALGLLTAYLLLVARALGSGVAVSCSCFGGLGASSLSRLTVVRNGLFVVLAALAVVDTATGGWVPGRLAALGDQAWWLVAMAAATAVSALVVARPSSAAVPDHSGGAAPPKDAPLPVPDLPVRLPDGSEVSLRDLAAERDQLLLFLSPACGPCLRVTERLASYAERLPRTDLRVVTALAADDVELLMPQWRPYLLPDPGSVVAGAFSIRGRPQAVLLGRDGVLAGGPVRGDEAVHAFVDDLEQQVAGHRLRAEG